MSATHAQQSHLPITQELIQPDDYDNATPRQPTGQQCEQTHTPDARVPFGRPWAVRLHDHLHEPVDLTQFWACSQAVRNLVLPNLVPAVVWGPEVLTWARDPKRRDMLPFVKRMNLKRMNVESLVGVLPPNLTQLTFSTFFNQSLTAGVLSANLTHLTFGGHFNQALVAGVLPPNLTQLTFGLHFNQPLAAGVLPVNLTHLTFSAFDGHFNQPLEASSSQPGHLTFGFNFNLTHLIDL